jgi:hypothetical protein
MGTTITPNMSLVLANPAGSSNPEPGPQYAADNNESFTIIDSHNHSPGSGVQITPAGLNINTNLTFQNNSATNVYGVQFSVPAASSNLTFLYTNAQSGGGITDLFYNDGAGNVIALTKAGEVNATIASLPGESYAGGTFTWKQGAGSTTPANFDIGSITIRPNVAATTYGVVLGPPSGISSQYNIQLPFVPGSTGIMRLDSSGNMSATLQPDNSTIVISSNTLQVPTGGITGTQIATSTVTKNNLVPRATGSTVSAGGMAISGSCGSFFNSTTSQTQPTNFLVTITTTGGPVVITMTSDGSGNSACIQAGTGSGGLGGVVYCYNQTTAAYVGQHRLSNSTGVGNFVIYPSSSCVFVDTPAAGTQVYQILIATEGASVTSIGIQYSKMIAYEP